MPLRSETLLLALCLALCLTTQLACEAIDPAASSVLLDGESVHQVFDYQSNRVVDGVDLLFVVDSSSSMKSKQEILEKSLPGIIGSLIRHECQVQSTGEFAGYAESCPEGSSRVHTSIRGLNVGVISASLGGQGAEYCLDEVGRHHNDRAHLMPSVRPELTAAGDSGVIKWRGDQEEIPSLIEKIQEQVLAVGTRGCERQAPLEAWYRFLVEPRPPLNIVLDSDGHAGPELDHDGKIVLDTELLRQREAFLRPQELLAVVMLTDQDDCSTMAGGALYENASLGHLMHQEALLPHGSGICELNPNDACCVPCSQPELAPEGCDLSACEGDTRLAPEDDSAALRCVDQRRRFGTEFVYPLERYVDGLTRPEVLDSWSGEAVDNPLLRGVGTHQGRPRDPGLVFPIALAGLPSQDVLTGESLDSTPPETLSSAELAQRTVHVGDQLTTRWQLLVGEPGLPARASSCQGESSSPLCGVAPTPALDPFMLQSLAPRAAGTNPITGDPIVGPESLAPWANAINGHEHSDEGSQALQLACTFPLDEERDCSSSEEGCACGENAPEGQALCQPPEGGEAASLQYLDGASPSPRILRVLRDVGANALLASACPFSNAYSREDTSTPYGLPFAHLKKRLSDTVLGRGLPFELDVDDEGLVGCLLLEATALGPEFEESPETPSCDDLGRDPLTEQQENLLLKHLIETERCGDETTGPCDAYRLCSIKQLTGQARADCLTEPNPDEEHENPGFCYIDPSKVSAEGEALAGGDPNPIVDNLPASERRLLRTVGGAPAPNSFMLIACQQ